MHDNLHSPIQPSGTQEQRMLVSVVLCLADMLKDANDLPALTTPQAATKAICDVLGDELATALADRLAAPSEKLTKIIQLINMRSNTPEQP